MREYREVMDFVPYGRKMIGILFKDWKATQRENLSKLIEIPEYFKQTKEILGMHWFIIVGFNTEYYRIRGDRAIKTKRVSEYTYVLKDTKEKCPFHLGQIVLLNEDSCFSIERNGKFWYAFDPTEVLGFPEEVHYT